MVAFDISSHLAIFDRASRSAQTDGNAMSDISRTPTSPPPNYPLPHLELLIERIVEATLAKAGALESRPFINSKACAELLGVAPEHLCAMRSRGQGPPWSGDGKWIRYRRSDVIRWLSQLPTRQQAPR
ncbi:helix-turn-helix domain-containing protein [Bradyrhizobium sp. RT3b]|uniref:helix-turn-helix domain-containing protein n=1 Tax=Bradyrhizobium sp. RT3b TaxID=3156334 RepID=UPI003394C88C